MHAFRWLPSTASLAMLASADTRQGPTQSHYPKRAWTADDVANGRRSSRLPAGDTRRGSPLLACSSCPEEQSPAQGPGCAALSNEQRSRRALPEPYPPIPASAISRHRQPMDHRYSTWFVGSPCATSCTPQPTDQHDPRHLRLYPQQARLLLASCSSAPFPCSVGSGRRAQGLRMRHARAVTGRREGTIKNVIDETAGKKLVHSDTAHPMSHVRLEARRADPHQISCDSNHHLPGSARCAAWIRP